MRIDAALTRARCFGVLQMSQPTVLTVDKVGTACDALRKIDGSVSPALGICLTALEQLHGSMTAPVRIAIAGQYNSGKTSLANSVLGQPVLPTSAVANTQVPVFARYGSTPRLEAVTGTARYDIDPAAPLDLPSADRLRRLVVTLPVAFLKTAEIMDTPSSADIRATADVSDMIVWCTMAPQAWGETERQACARLPARCRRWSILAATHADTLGSADAIERVRGRLEAEATEHFARIALVDTRPAHLRDTSGSVACPAGIEDVAGIITQSIAAMRAKRTRAGLRIARRIARLTLRNLDPAWDGNSMLPVWEEAVVRLRRALRAKPRGEAVRQELATPNARDTIERFDNEIAGRFPHEPRLGERMMLDAAGIGTSKAIENVLEDMSAILYLVAQDIPAGFGTNGQPERLAACSALLPLIVSGDAVTGYQSG